MSLFAGLYNGCFNNSTSILSRLFIHSFSFIDRIIEIMSDSKGITDNTTTTNNNTNNTNSSNSSCCNVNHRIDPLLQQQQLLQNDAQDTNNSVTSLYIPPTTTTTTTDSSNDSKTNGIDTNVASIVSPEAVVQVPTVGAVGATERYGPFITPYGDEINSKNTLQSFENHPRVIVQQQQQQEKQQEKQQQQKHQLDGVPTIPTTSTTEVITTSPPPTTTTTTAAAAAAIVQAEVVQSYDVIDAEPYYSVAQTTHERITAIVERDEARKRLRKIKKYSVIGGIILILICVIVVLVVVLLFVLGSNDNQTNPATEGSSSSTTASPMTTTITTSVPVTISPIQAPNTTTTTETPTVSPSTTKPTVSPTIEPTISLSASLQVACNFFRFPSITECLNTTEFDTLRTDVTVNGTTIPTEIQLLIQLEHLELYNSGLSGTIPTTIDSLSRLTLLSLYKNKLTGTIPSSTWNHLTLLEYLSLSYNALTSTIPTTIGSLSNLTALLVSDNQLTGSIPSTLNRLTLLENLYLYNNIGLMGSISLELCNNTIAGRDNNIRADCYNSKITCTCCRDNESKELCTSFTVACNFLNFTSIAECQSTTIFDSTEATVNGFTIPTEIGLLTQLTRLQLYASALKGLIPTTIGDLSLLTTLDLSSNVLTGSIPSTLNRLTRLEDLSLHSNIGLMGSIPSEMCNNTNAGRYNLINIDCDNKNITCTCCSDGNKLEFCTIP